MAGIVRCTGCEKSVVPVRPTWGGRALVPLAWGAAAALVLLGGLTGPFLVTLTPFVFLAGVSLIRVAHEAAFHPPHCPDPVCRKDLSEVVGEVHEARGRLPEAAPPVA